MTAADLACVVLAFFSCVDAAGRPMSSTSTASTRRRRDARLSPGAVAAKKNSAPRAHRAPSGRPRAPRGRRSSGTRRRPQVLARDGRHEGVGARGEDALVVGDEPSPQATVFCPRLNRSRGRRRGPCSSVSLRGSLALRRVLVRADQTQVVGVASLEPGRSRTRGREPLLEKLRCPLDRCPSSSLSAQSSTRRWPTMPLPTTTCVCFLFGGAESGNGRECLLRAWRRLLFVCS